MRRVASHVPESAAPRRRAVVRRQPVVVAVVSGEHHVVVARTERIAGVTRVAVHQQPVVVGLRQYRETAVLRRVPVAGVAARLQVELQLVAVAAHRQLAEQFVAEPVVASGVVEADFELRPRTIEEREPVEILLDQQRNAVCYRTVISISKSRTASQYCFPIPSLTVGRDITNSLKRL